MKLSAYKEQRHHLLLALLNAYSNRDSEIYIKLDKMAARSRDYIPTTYIKYLSRPLSLVLTKTCKQKICYFQNKAVKNCWIFPTFSSPCATWSKELKSEQDSEATRRKESGLNLLVKESQSQTRNPFLNLLFQWKLKSYYVKPLYLRGVAFVKAACIALTNILTI